MFDQHDRENINASTAAKTDVTLNQNMISDVKHAVSNINNEIIEIKDCLKKHIFEDLATCFKCLICFEPNGYSFFNCPYCGSFLGCFSCINKLNKCPICNTEFKCSGCKINLHRQPYKIPGIEEFVPRKNPITSQNLINTINDEDSTTDDDDDLPIVL